MKKLPNLILRFLPFTFICGYGGALFLRWHQLGLLYRTMDQFFVGIGSTLGAVTVLAIILSGFFVKVLKPMSKLAKRIEAGEAVTEEDKHLATKAYKWVVIFTFIENAAGFIVGQISVSFIDFAAGNYPFTPSRFAIICVQAICLGLIVSLYEIYYFDLLFQSYREALQIHSIKDLGRKRTGTISSKILLIAVVSLISAGTNTFSTGYGLINGDYIEGVDLMKEYLSKGVLCIIINLLECSGLMFIVCLEMKNRIKKVTYAVQELTDSGDLSLRINISLSDDIGNLTSCQNDLMDKLSETIDGVKKETSKVSSAADVLNNSSSKSMDALYSMKQSFDTIGIEEKKTNEIINHTYLDIESLRESAVQVEQQILNQTHAVERASSSIEQIAKSLADISETTKQADTVSEDLRSTSEKGMKSIHSAEEAISLIQQSSANVQNTVAIIQKIASQTNLLAMNAAIEAAHAGEAGKGFAVVADEVRNLANTTSKNVQLVGQNIKEMEEKIMNGVGAMQDAKNAFNSINDGVGTTADIVSQIAQSIEAQRIETNETLQATQEVVQSINSVKELAVSQRQHTDNVYENTKNIVDSSNEISRSLSQTEEASNNLNEVINEVNNCVSENVASVQKMKVYIDGFKTEIK